jgi:uncharacterized protein with FMN-binding domain
MAQSGSNKKVANSLVAVSSAAVLAVYTAGYMRTKSSADRFALQAAERRHTVQGAPASGPLRPVPANVPALESSPASPAASPVKREGAVAPRQIASVQPSPAIANVPSAPAAPAPAEAIAPAAAPVTPAAAPAAAPAADPPPPPAIVEQKAEAPAAPPAAPAKITWKDGTYLGWGYSRHGDIEASVVVEGGRITAATISQCLTRYSCSVISALPPQVAQRQSPEVDWVSGATQSADAFSYAVADALSKAK